MQNDTPTAVELVPQNPAALPTRLVYLEPVNDTTQQRANQRGIPELWELIRSRLLTLCFVVFVALLGAAVYTFMQRPEYVASTTVQLQGPSEGIGVVDANADRSDDAMLTQIRILESRSLKKAVEQALATTNQEWSIRPSRFEQWAASAGISKLPSTVTNGLPPAEMTFQNFAGTRLLKIQCESTDPEFAAKYANTAAQQFGEMQAESHVESAQHATKWINQQIEEVREKLRKAESELQTFSKNAGRLNGPDSQSVDQTRLAQMEMETLAASADRVKRQAAFEVANQNPAETVPQVADNDRLSQNALKISDLKRELAELRTTLTPEHYLVKRVEAQIAELENAAKTDKQNLVARIRNDYTAALRREQLLKDSYLVQKNIVTQQASSSVYYDLLKREVESDRKLYDELLAKSKTASLSAAMTGNTVQVIDPAEVPTTPVQPTPVRNFAIALLSGLIAGVLLIVGSDHINRSLRAPGETPYYLGVPELGIIPAHGRESLNTRASTEIVNTKPLSVTKSSNGASNSLVEFQSSLVAESFRSTVASILSSPQVGNRPQVILVTSPGRGDGKSTTVSSLGSTLAEINQRVLLIDADMRKPHLHHLFNISNSWGLSTLLQEKTSLQGIPVEAIVKRTHIPDLSILPSGPGTATIANLLYSPRLNGLIERVRKDFDVILIDTPPMSYISDARVLGRVADAVVLVVRAGQTTRDDALQAKNRLTGDGTRLLGTILNAWDSRSKTRYAYYRYGDS